jgi:hypothetical protein
MADDGRTIIRQFRCRARLWRTFEQMSEELEKDIDELVNDAMTAYAQLSGYETAAHANTPAPDGADDTGPNAVPPGGGGRYTTAEESASPALPQPVREPHSGRRAPPPLPMPPPAPPMPSRFGRATPLANPSLVAAGLTPPLPPVEAAMNGATLYLVFDNQKYRIDKDQFIIGRGSKSSDLPIKDGNISRKHAAVIRRNGTYFIKDLGSTNGIDFKGMRIDNKRIDEGDVFHLCEYELRFTYRR